MITTHTTGLNMVLHHQQKSARFNKSRLHHGLYQHFGPPGRSEPIPDASVPALASFQAPNANHRRMARLLADQTLRNQEADWQFISCQSASPELTPAMSRRYEGI